MNKLKMQSLDKTRENIEKIKLLFPEVVTEIRDKNGIVRNGINFERLRQELSSEIAEGEECYEFSWVGKKAAVLDCNSPIKKTLRPCIEESIDWENTGNLYIEGDNLDVLKLLQKSYRNRIKMIYIDPPYNSGNDYIYKDDYSLERKSYSKNRGADKTIADSELKGRFHSGWCSMMYSKIRNYIYINLSPNIYQEMACSIALDPETRKLMDNKSILEYGGYLLTKTSSGKVRQYSSLAEPLHQNDEYKSEYGRVTIRGNLWKGFFSDMMNVAREGNVEYKNGKKPVRLIYQLAKWIGVEDGDIILNFFSGSATTAHAVMQLNSEDQGKRKYIMIQLDENLDQSLQNAVGMNKRVINKTIGFLDNVNRTHFLSELGKERILRAGREINEKLKNSDKKHPIDTGFRVFKLDTANITDDYYTIPEYDNHMITRLESYAKEDRNDLDILYGACWILEYRFR